MSKYVAEEVETRNYWEAAQVVRALVGRPTLSSIEADNLADAVVELRGIVANTDNFTLRNRANEALKLADTIDVATTAGSVA